MITKTYRLQVENTTTYEDELIKIRGILLLTFKPETRNVRIGMHLHRRIPSHQIYHLENNTYALYSSYSQLCSDRIVGTLLHFPSLAVLYQAIKTNESYPPGLADQVISLGKLEEQ